MSRPPPSEPPPSSVHLLFKADFSDSCDARIKARVRLELGDVVAVFSEEALCGSVAFPPLIRVAALGCGAPWTVQKGALMSCVLYLCHTGLITAPLGDKRLVPSQFFLMTDMNESMNHPFAPLSKDWRSMSINVVWELSQCCKFWRSVTSVLS